MYSILCFCIMMAITGCHSSSINLFENEKEHVCCDTHCWGQLPVCDGESLLQSEIAICKTSEDDYFWSFERGVSLIKLHEPYYSCHPLNCDDSFIFYDNITEYYAQSNSSCNCTANIRAPGWYDVTGQVTSCLKTKIGVSYDVNPVPSTFTAGDVIHVEGRRDSGDVDALTCDVFVTLIDNGKASAYIALIQAHSSPSLNDWVVALRKGKWHQSFTCHGPSCSVPISFEASLTSGSLFVDALVGSEVCGSFKIELVGTKLCRSSDCVFCQNAWNHMKCLSSSERFFLVLCWITIVFMVFLMFPVFTMFMAFLISKCLSCPGYIFKSCKSVGDSSFAKDIASGWRRATNYFTSNKEKTEMDKLDSKILPKKVSGTRLSTVLVTIFFLPLCIAEEIPPTHTFDYPCSASVVSIASLDECQVLNSEGLRSCNLMNSITSTIPSAGTSLCVEFVQEVSGSNNISVAYMEVTYLYAIDSISTSTAYFTGAWSISGCSIAQNYQKGSSGCSKTEVCTRIQSNARPIEQDFDDHQCLFDTERNYGCFLCQRDGSYSCSEWAYGIQVIASEQYEVRNYGTQVYSPYVRIKVTDSTGEVQESTMKATGTEITHFNKFKIQALGSLSRNTVPLFLAGSKIVQKKANFGNVGQVWIAPASSTNSPELNKIGDIQAISYEKLRRYWTNPADFIYAQGLVTPNNNCPSAVTFTTSVPGINQLSSGNNDIYAVPGIIYNDLWFWNDGAKQLRTNITSPPAVLMKISFADEMKITVVDNVICPDVELISASGCYSCSIGSAIVVSAKSTCMSGLATITSSDDDVLIVTSTILLTTSYQEFLIQIQTGKADNSFELLFSSGDRSDSVFVEFEAVVKPPNITDPNTIVNCTNGATCPQGKKTKNSFDAKLKPSGFVDFFENTIGEFFNGVFDGAGKWYHEFIMFISIIVMVVILYFMFVGGKMIASILPESYVGKTYKRIGVKDKEI